MSTSPSAADGPGPASRSARTGGSSRTAQPGGSSRSARPGGTSRSARPGPDLSRERELLADLPDDAVVLGVDEVGRGALAGPVTIGVCAVGRAVGEMPVGLTDSKMLRPAAREALVEPVRQWSAAWAVGHASPAEIDSLGILAAQRLAARRALAVVRSELAAAGLVAGATILDGAHDWLAEPVADLLALVSDDVVPPPGDSPRAWDVPVLCEVKGDMRCASVSGASVLAKVERDALMVEAALRPELEVFGLAGNKGYGSARHLAALADVGPSDWHRRSWRLPTRRGA
ncbi:ribonuclease HII [Georgenia sp. Z1491]|uniref:ribonuclease HII n=1 Tax=Georgenia sp. Z1491 TaxID=3416707 RepID=UPI003CF294B1